MVDCKALNVVQLIHEPPGWQTGARDFEFSRSTMEANWALGGAAVEAAMKDGHLLAQSIAEGRSESFAVQAEQLRPKAVALPRPSPPYEESTSHATQQQNRHRHRITDGTRVMTRPRPRRRSADQQRGRTERARTR